MENKGEELKKIRLERGLTLEEVHKKTKIHLGILEAIEGDSLTRLSPVYLNGFIKIYCKFLGVDPKDFVSESKEAKYKIPEKAVPKDPAVESKQGIFASDAKDKISFDFILNKLSTFRLNEQAKKVIVWGLVIFIGSFSLFRISKFISARIKSAQESASSRQPQQKSQTAAASVASPSQAIPTPITSEIRLVIKANQNCWVTLKADGKLVFHRVLEKGRSESWKAKERIDLSLGNAGGVELEVNGQLFSSLGRRGQALKNIVITKKGMDIGR